VRWHIIDERCPIFGFRRRVGVLFFGLGLEMGREELLERRRIERADPILQDRQSALTFMWRRESTEVDSLPARPRSSSSTARPRRTYP